MKLKTILMFVILLFLSLFASDVVIERTVVPQRELVKSISCESTALCIEDITFPASRGLHITSTHKR